MNDFIDPEPEIEPQIIPRAQVLTELLDWCNKFISTSKEWRRSSYESNWLKWQRNADSVYDPEIKAKKRKDQSTAFWPITPSHRENALAQLYKTEVGPRPPLQVKARPGVVLPELGMMDQSENIRDLILREREKSRFEVTRNSILDDKTTYGSGFARMRFEEDWQDRKVRKPIYEPISVFDPTSVMRAMSGQRQIVGYEDVIEKVLVYRGVRFEYISIWDFFPDPKALEIKGNPCAYRYETTYGEILAGVEAGYYLPEAAEALKGLASEETTPEDKKQVEADRLIADSQVQRTDYGRKFQCYELFARLPMKWVLVNGESIEDPNKLIPAIIRFHDKTVIGIQVNDSYDGEPQIFKDDYMPVAGQFYGRGIPEMLKDVQLVSNETVNQRLDAGGLALDQKYAVFEKALVDGRDFDTNVIRVKQQSQFNDIRQMFMRLDMGNVPTDAFIEPQEWERAGQERTSITRSTLGTAGQVKDANQTLGGMEMLKAASGDKMAYIGMLSEFGFQYEVNRAYWKLIYQNYQPEDIALALGPKRAQTFVLMSPEEVENSYQYYPTGVYSMENKAMRSARLAQTDQLYANEPWWNRVESAKANLQSQDEDPDRFILPEAEAMMLQQKAQMMANQMVGQAIEQKQQEDKLKNALPDTPKKEAKK